MSKLPPTSAKTPPTMMRVTNPNAHDNHKARERRRARSEGWQTDGVLVDAAATRVLVNMMLMQGHSACRIAEVAHISPDCISDLIKPTKTHVQYGTAQSIEYAAELLEDEQPRSVRRLPAEPYRTMMRRYAALGWRLADLIERAGVAENVVRDRALWIKPEDAERLDRLFAELAERAPDEPDRLSARTWFERGYLPPAADDISHVRRWWQSEKRVRDAD